MAFKIKSTINSNNNFDLSGIISKLVLGDSPIVYLEDTDIINGYEFKNGTIYAFIKKLGDGELYLYKCSNDFSSVPENNLDDIFNNGNYFDDIVENNPSGNPNATVSSLSTVEDLINVIRTFRGMTGDIVNIKNGMSIDFSSVKNPGDSNISKNSCIIIGGNGYNSEIPYLFI